MIDKVNEDRTGTAFKRIYSSMEESIKQIMEVLKIQRTSRESERTNMSLQEMYLTLQVLDNDNAARQKIIGRMT